MPNCNEQNQKLIEQVMVQGTLEQQKAFQSALAARLAIGKRILGAMARSRLQHPW